MLSPHREIGRFSRAARWLLGACFAAALLTLLLAGPRPADARGVTGGTINLGTGAASITLGISRSEVISRLGKPYYENRNGYMQYSNDFDKASFDVYLDAETRTVDMLGIAGDDFVTAEGVRIFGKGGLRQLSGIYGNRLKPRKVRMDPLYRLFGEIDGRRTATDFFVERQSLSARVMQVFIRFRH